MAYKVTRHDVIVWLQGKHDEFSGEHMDAEEKGNVNKMTDMGEKTDEIDELIDRIREL